MPRARSALLKKKIANLGIMSGSLSVFLLLLLFLQTWYFFCLFHRLFAESPHHTQFSMVHIWIFLLVSMSPLSFSLPLGPTLRIGHVLRLWDDKPRCLQGMFLSLRYSTYRLDLDFSLSLNSSSFCVGFTHLSYHVRFLLTTIAIVYCFLDAAPAPGLILLPPLKSGNLLRFACYLRFAKPRYTERILRWQLRLTFHTFHLLRDLLCLRVYLASISLHFALEFLMELSSHDFNWPTNV